MGERISGFAVKIARWRPWAGRVYLIAAAVLGRGSGRWFAAGLAAALTGELFRTWAAGTIRKNQQLAQTGPYQRCRHPLYLGSLLVAAGIALAAQHLLIWVLLVVCFPLFYGAAISCEERFLRAAFGDSYEQYRARTPLLLPFGRGGTAGSFSWGCVRRNEEFVNWASTAAVFLLIGLRGLR